MKLESVYESESVAKRRGVCSDILYLMQCLSPVFVAGVTLCCIPNQRSVTPNIRTSQSVDVNETNQ